MGMKPQEGRKVSAPYDDQILTLWIVDMKSSIAEIMWKRMMKAKITNMADTGAGG